jgi:hypothetical protein
VYCYEWINNLDFGRRKYPNISISKHLAKGMPGENPERSFQKKGLRLFPFGRQGIT